MIKKEAVVALLEYIKPGDTVYTVLRHRSASGMSRSISLFTIREGAPWCIDHFASRVLGNKFDEKNGGLKIGGCGMDMGFALVYNLGQALWPCGTPVPHGTRNGAPDSDGGYALKQRWL